MGPTQSAIPAATPTRILEVCYGEDIITEFKKSYSYLPIIRSHSEPATLIADAPIT